MSSSYQSVPIQEITQSKPDTTEEEEGDEDEEDDEEQKKSFMRSLDSLQKILLEFQVLTGLVASYCERVSNLFQWEEAALSNLWAALLLLTSLLLWLLGLRTLLLLWGLNKFTKKLRDSNPVTTNEIDNLLLRVPDYEMVLDAKEIYS